jgi:hypothetical protein
MPFGQGRVSNIEVAGIATIVLSLAVLAFIGFSICPARLNAQKATGSTVPL